MLSHRHVEEQPEILEARVRSDEGRVLRFRISVDVKAFRAARVPRRRSEVRNLRRRVRYFPKLSSTRGDAWLDFG